MLCVSLCTILLSCFVDRNNFQGGKKIRLSENGIHSLLVVDIESGDTILADNHCIRLTPASLTKLFTSACAVELLGVNFRFNTKFYFDDENLYVLGGADPTLGSDRFKKSLANVIFSDVYKGLRGEGISTVAGDVVIDCSRYAKVNYPSKRMWEDMANYYGAIPAALSYKENAFEMTLQSAKVGEKCKILKTEPDPGVDFHCFVLGADNSKDSAYIYGHPDMDKWYVSGTIPSNRNNFVIKGALPCPAESFGMELKMFLHANGIRILGDIVIKHKSLGYDDKTLFLEHSSPNLLEILKVVNQNSNNLYADHLLFELDSEEQTPDWNSATRKLNEYWFKKLPENSISLYDGSGLSPANKISASDMVDLLLYMQRSELAVDFKSSLSKSGESGTLKRFLKDEKIGSVLGKSGSMNGVLGYSGYLQTDSGRQLAFCILLNNFTESFSEIRMNIESQLSDLIHSY